MAINVPTKVRDLRMFVGLVNYYRYMWCKRPHTLASLTELCLTNVKFKWTEVEHYAFIDTKKILARVFSLYCHNFSEIFKMHTGSSKKKLWE